MCVVKGANPGLSVEKKESEVTKFLAFIVSIFVILAFVGVVPATAQESVPASSGSISEPEPEEEGTVLPYTDQFRIRVRFMSGYGHDGANASLGFEKQGRVGYAIVNLFGKINDRFSYRFEINPVNESQPLPSCGEQDFFYPNLVQNFGPNVICDNDGRMRVDDYRFIALDPVNQQGPIRQAYVQYDGPVSVRFGRFLLPIGFDWEESGSLTAKDATHIQRINAETNFGMMFSLGGDRANVNAATFIGDGNRFRDYTYFYFLDGSLDSNSALTALLSGNVKPIDGLDIRAAYKRGYTGSKVERLPNYFASKRNDFAKVASVRYQPVSFGSVFGEYANYTWGITRTSAELIGITDGEPVKKDGYYVGGEMAVPVTDSVTLGAVVTREELSRDDALIKFLATQSLYGVQMGKKERSTAIRVFLELGRQIKVGFYRNFTSNPYPWVSGIWPVAGERSFTGRDSDKWGIVVKFTVG